MLSTRPSARITISSNLPSRAGAGAEAGADSRIAGAKTGAEGAGARTGAEGAGAACKEKLFEFHFKSFSDVLILLLIH